MVQICRLCKFATVRTVRLTGFGDGLRYGCIPTPDDQLVAHLEQRASHQFGLLQHQFDHLVIRELFIG